MDELDFLKQHWQKDQDFPKVNQEEIRSMLHKSSSSLVKWIFIISLIELFLGILVNVAVFIYDKNAEALPLGMDILTGIIDVGSYIVILYFIYAFFNSYRKIKNTNNTKELLSNILVTRKTVGYYIKFNIYLIIVGIGLSAMSLIWEEDVLHKTVGHNIMFITMLVIVLFLFGWLSIAIVKMVYKFIYIRLVKKLEKNYEELERLENEMN
ncbi:MULTISPECIES: hypothetical protein [Sphingobacterium]|uniref:Uncharacterized protein n=1 Tax=Sphingobacterium cellulitidis TaxID=1768011 RepID=A0A8H9KWB4_9SPHI|nr:MULTISPECIES: hypothetical protein [Sphingobacterium]MBA8985329.1 hypothetical protein [Sphingobacterium soli]WFB63751.1 hypothetical protein PZ892_00765 [Sphingobacterium sp. WM]GGE10532.1 hypothetical protein GCM10011516_05300 [Sphingobacterium soli]